MKKQIQHLLTISLCLLSFLSQAQEKKKLPKHEKEAIQFIFEGNQEITKEKANVVEAEKAYRKAIAKDPNNATAYHNLGNSYLGTGQPDKAIEAYKNALRNNPTDHETRYNLALAKKMKQEQDKNKPKDGDKNKEDKKDGDKKEDSGKDEKNKDGDKEKKENDKKDGEDEKDKKDEGDKKDELSPEQVKSLLQAMENQEKKVQEKVNAKKVKGVRVKSDKDW